MANLAKPQENHKTYDLYIGDPSFSSWSLRGWLMFEKFGIAYKSHMVGIYDGTMKAALADLAPARLMPLMRTPDGVLVGDTLAMAETLAERHSDKGLWPADPAARGLARWIVAEMHSGLGALRSACPMQLLHVYEGLRLTDGLLADLARVEELWGIARSRHGAGGPWLFGAYSIADAFYAPVAARIAGYDLKVGQVAADYVAQTLADPEFRRWRAMGLERSYDPVPYAMDLPHRPWPVA